MAALDLLGRRWALRVLWELRAGPVGFRALQARCDGMSPSVLSTRLTELGDAGIVGVDEGGDWTLTPVGTGLLEALAPLHAWSERWARAPRDR
ncbi:MAG: helix-turn-helix transcriptional regulator [Myxococcales bacterium]|nr:helix-turn-helix transcriptional regulator [Myxococcales bacterium]